MIKFTIGLKPITKKNSQRIITNRKTGRPMILPSKQYKTYEKEAGHFLRGRGLKIDYPVNLKATYYMPTRRKVDLSNLHEALQDILVKYEVIADDNYKVIAGHDGSRVKVDKEKPRTEVVIQELDREPRMKMTK